MCLLQIMWETDKLPDATVMQSDTALFIRRDTSDPRPDLMYHIYSVPFADNTERLGYPRPQHAICMVSRDPTATDSIGELNLCFRSTDT